MIRRLLDILDMASVNPIALSDLNSVSLNPTDILTDEYLDYVKSPCSSLGTEDYPGYQDWLEFMKDKKGN